MKLPEFVFSPALRKDSDFMDFVSAVRDAINVGSSAVLTNIQLTGQTGDITTTKIYTPSTPCLFRLSAYMTCTVAGAGTLSFVLGFTDEFGARTAVSTVDLSSTINGALISDFFYSTATDITYATSIAGIGGSPKYSLRLALEQIG